MIALMTQELEKYYEIKKSIIFESRAMGNYKKGSDVDIVGENKG